MELALFLTHNLTKTMKTLLDVIIELRRLTQSNVIKWEYGNSGGEYPIYGAKVSIGECTFLTDTFYGGVFMINDWMVEQVLVNGLEEIKLLKLDVLFQLVNSENGESFTAIWKLLQRIEQEHTQSH